jgi:hypothetical protein
MRKLLIYAPTLLLVLVVAALASPRAEAGSWTGWITDESCAAKGANAAHRDCAVKCHKGGARLVFYDNADQKLYKLDDQAAAEGNLGYEVTVAGELDGDTIHVASIGRAGGGR